MFVWEQADATFRGIDGEIRWNDIEFASGSLQLRGFFDVIRASLDTATEKKLPLIPPNRVGLSATQDWGAVALTFEAYAGWGTGRDTQLRVAHQELYRYRRPLGMEANLAQRPGFDRISPR